MERKTVLSSCRTYRYCLWREWDNSNTRYVMFIGVNPSTADEVEDDATIRRCVGYAKNWGFGALCMVNLFAFRARDPEDMKLSKHPIGSDNDRWIMELSNEAEWIIAGWGKNGTHLNRDREVKRMLRGKLSCLSITEEGHPGHPLYLKKSLTPISYC